MFPFQALEGEFIYILSLLVTKEKEYYLPLLHVHYQLLTKLHGNLHCEGRKEVIHNNNIKFNPALPLRSFRSPRQYYREGIPYLRQHGHVSPSRQIRPPLNQNIH